MAGLMVLPSLVLAAAAAPPRPRDNPAALSQWVTVGSAGNAATITPAVTTINGAKTTISPAPGHLTSTSAYTLTFGGGAATTSTGLAPAASATGTGDEGAFLVCNNYQGQDSPFCQPRRGSQLAPGHVYYITWDTSYFSNTNTTLEVQAQYDHGEGFTSHTMGASAGFYAWDVSGDFLTKLKASAVNVSLFLAFDDNDGNSATEMRLTGPSVLVTNSPSGSGGSHGPPAAAIAIPVVIALLALGLLGFCVWSWRRHGRVPLLGALCGGRRRSGGQGYGVRQSHAQRTGGGAAVGKGSGKTGGAGVGIQLTDRDSWSPTSQGRNVFREEIRRQDRETR